MRRADQSFRGVLLCVHLCVCVSNCVIVKPRPPVGLLRKTFISLLVERLCK